LQPITLHVPLTQLLPAAHETPQPPQFALVFRAVSHPFADDPSQLPKPTEHVNPHTPEAHTGDAFGPDGQTLPHVPQFVGSLLVVRQPLSPQHICPAPHAGMQPAAAHMPPTQSWPAPQAIPHPPQLAGSLVSFTHAAPQHVRPGLHIVPPQSDWQNPPTHD
jgi:hypothetical protein